MVLPRSAICSSDARIEYAPGAGVCTISPRLCRTMSALASVEPNHAILPPLPPSVDGSGYAPGPGERVAGSSPSAKPSSRAASRAAMSPDGVMRGCTASNAACSS